jgi:hypothetical protein
VVATAVSDMVRKRSDESGPMINASGMPTPGKKSRGGMGAYIDRLGLCAWTSHEYLRRSPSLIFAEVESTRIDVRSGAGPRHH